MAAQYFMMVIVSPIFGSANDPPQGFDFDDFSDAPSQGAPQRQGPR